MAHALPKLLLAVSVLGTGAACESGAQVDIAAPATSDAVVDAEAITPVADAAPDPDAAPTADAAPDGASPDATAPTTCEDVVCEPAAGLNRLCALVLGADPPRRARPGVCPTPAGPTGSRRVR